MEGRVVFYWDVWVAHCLIVSKFAWLCKEQVGKCVLADSDSQLGVLKQSKRAINPWFWIADNTLNEIFAD